MKTQDISRLRTGGKRNFLIGLTVSLALVIMAFRWTVPAPDFSEGDLARIEEDIPVVRTVQQEEQRLPPAGQIVSHTDVAEDPIFTPEPLPDTLSLTNPQPGADAVPGPDLDPAPYRAPTTPPPLPQPVVEEPPLLVVEVMPRFPGCEEGQMPREAREQCALLELLKFVQSHLRYPEAAREIGLEGLVVVRFIIEKDGSLADVQLVKDIGAGCGKEAVRVVKLMPPWRPGMQQGRKVRVAYNLPVKFQLN